MEKNAMYAYFILISQLIDEFKNTKSSDVASHETSCRYRGEQLSNGLFEVSSPKTEKSF